MKMCHHHHLLEQAVVGLMKIDRMNLYKKAALTIILSEDRITTIRLK